MLENISLDTEGFEEIFRKARSQISEVYPKWNDYNYHDPGITLLELFAFLKEAEQFYMDHVSEDVVKGFLKLLGVVQNKVVPASVYADFIGTTSISKGEKLYVNDICYEAEETCEVIHDNIRCMITDTVIPYSAEHFRVYPFSKKPQEGEECYLGLNVELEPDKCYKLSVEIEPGKTVMRNPIVHIEDFTRLGEIEFSYWNGTEFKVLNIVDTTVDFLQSGTVYIQLQEKMCKTSIQGVEGYFLRIRLKQCVYDIAPLIRGLSFSNIELYQRKTIAQFVEVDKLHSLYQEGKSLDYYKFDGKYYEQVDSAQGEYVAIYDEEYYPNKILGRGNGFPNQKYYFDTDIIDSQRIEIFCGSILYENKYARFTRVDDFGTSVPNSWHYVVNEEKGEISFGDGIRGICPENDIVIVALAFSKGKTGNIATGNQVHSADYTKKGNVYKIVRNGMSPESLEMAARRVDREEVTRMVSAADYETVIKQTEGLLIEECMVLDDDYSDISVVKVVVKPAYQTTTLSDVYKKNIIQYMEEKRLLGTTIQLQSPTYTMVDIFIEVVVKPEFLYAKEIVIQTIEEYFKSLDGFGKITEYNTLYRRINSLKEVSAIYSLSIGAKGDGITRSRTGDVITPATSVTILEHIHCNVVN